MTEPRSLRVLRGSAKGPTPEDDIEQFRTLFVRSNTQSWEMGRLVARNVERQPRGRPWKNARAGIYPQKMSIQAWAQRVGVPRMIISRHLDAWDRAAEAGLVKHAEDIVLGENVDLPDADWQDFYDGHGSLATSAPKPVPEEPEDEDQEEEEPEEARPAARRRRSTNDDYQNSLKRHQKLMDMLPKVTKLAEALVALIEMLGEDMPVEEKCRVRECFDDGRKRILVALHED